MLSHMIKLFTVACVLLNLSPVLSVETVSIISLYPSNQHSCVTRCIYTYAYSDIGNALYCGSPYDNNCFCNTASASASAASSWLTVCGSSQCSAGDITADLTSMHSIYASYCMNAGFTQPGATDWYNPSTTIARPGQTATSNSAQTTTQVTVVTQTAPSTPGSATTTQPQGKFLLLLAILPLLLLQVPLPVALTFLHLVPALFLRSVTNDIGLQ
jgi:hypothetical protein